MNIQDYYEYALAEGEGLGTAYEYYVKRKLMDRLVSKEKICTLLVYGLPEKYGLSVDFFLYGQMNKINVDLYEKNKEKIKELFSILQKYNIPKPNLVSRISKSYDLVLSSEVLQQFSNEERKSVINTLKKSSKRMILFMPNGYNKSHLKISGLKGIEPSIKNKIGLGFSFLDMPPFPPGIKKKKRVTSTTFIGVLQIYADLEKYFPKFIKRRVAHIVYTSNREDTTY